MFKYLNTSVCIIDNLVTDYRVGSEKLDQNYDIYLINIYYEFDHQTVAKLLLCFRTLCMNTITHGCV